MQMRVEIAHQMCGQARAVNNSMADISVEDHLPINATITFGNIVIYDLLDMAVMYSIPLPISAQEVQ